MCIDHFDLRGPRTKRNRGSQIAMPATSTPTARQCPPIASLLRRSVECVRRKDEAGWVRGQVVTAGVETRAMQAAAAGCWCLGRARVGDDPVDDLWRIAARGENRRALNDDAAGRMRSGQVP